MGFSYTCLELHSNYCCRQLTLTKLVNGDLFLVDSRHFYVLEQHSCQKMELVHILSSSLLTFEHRLAFVQEGINPFGKIRGLTGCLLVIALQIKLLVQGA